MQTVIRAIKKNETYMFVTSEDSGVLREIHEHFTFEVPGAKFMPHYRSGQWDGLLRLFSLRTRTLYVGLLCALTKFANSRGYALELEDSQEYGPLQDNRTIDLSFITDLKLRAGGSAIEPKDYQLDAINHALKYSRAVLLSPTGSGKSLIIYCIIRKLMSEYPDKKILIVVPTVGLVSQMKSDFLDYASQDPSFTSEDVHQISAGAQKQTDCPVTISTWQSLVKMDRSFFSQFIGLIGDEAHGFKAKSLTDIMDKCIDVKYRIGTTGTIDDKSPVNPMTLEGIFGPIHRVTTTKKLIDNGTLAGIAVNVLQLKYADDIRRAMTKIDYQGEIDYLVTHPGRNAFIAKLVCDQKKNSLVLFNFVDKHGKVLRDMIRKMLDDSGQTERQVFFVAGEVKAEEREEVRRLTEQAEDAIIVASSGTFSTGINIRNLHSVFFVSPTKSPIRVLQSVGRGLRKHGEDKVMRLYDIIDDFSWKKRKNFALIHGVERMKLYAAEGFPSKIFTIDLKS